MIAELVRQADLMGLTGREPFRRRPVHWLIDLDEDGNVLGFTSTSAASAPNKGILGERRGKRFSIPANYLLGSPNQHNWRPDFLSGPADEIFPQGVDGANPTPHKQRDFCKLVDRAVQALPHNKTLLAIRRFLESGRQLIDLPMPQSAIENLDHLRKRQSAESETISFRVAGGLVWRDPEIDKWWCKTAHPSIYQDETEDCEELGGDAFQQGSGRITGSSPCVFGNVPLVSFNNAPFSSFGLGDRTARLRLDTVEKAAAALNALRQDGNTSLTLGDEKAVFWASTDDHLLDCSFITLLEARDPLAVADYLRSVWGSIPRELDGASFHVAVLLEGTGRFSVRSWDSGILGDVDRRFRAYFEAIRLPLGSPVNLGAMAASTIPKSKKARPSTATYNAIFNAAWRGSRLPFHVLESALSRQSPELAKGRTEGDKGEFEFRLRARTALVKLYFHSNAKGNDKPMNEHEHEDQFHPAYLCGRVLALLDKIHNAAHGKSTASSPAGRYYGSASSTPALVFPRLCKLARIHLEKIESRGWASLLDRELATIVSKFAGQASWPRTLSLEDQGRFAIGFYYERVPKGNEPTTDNNQTTDDSEQETGS
jgi:CRISPR-associated protein Cas8c/Csd1 subtype I-C